MQAKVESLTALNQYLKEQLEVKDRALADTEDKMRAKEDDMRRAYADLEAKNGKLKKREQLINQALKRLEVPRGVY